MATTSDVLPAARTVHLEAPCPTCQGQLTVYLFVYTVSTESKPGAISVNLEADHLIGPHACYPPQPAESGEATP